ncbi:anti-sigma B factor RsbW [Brevibacillus ginsengisoli]|uniref:anti-sigma B factor RsbW n=1 Tax=Brevibacillus ginsengisoli TaxID=363854 RepID=UPI003CF36034
MSEQHADKVIELTLPADVEFIGIARLLMSGVANRMGFAYDEIEDIKLAVAEACTNSVRHAYEGGQTGTFTITSTLHEDRLVVQVSDKGKSFDASQIKMAPLDPTKELEELTEGGLGLYLIHTLMDQVEIRSDDGILIEMVKYVQRDEVAYVDNESSQTRTE